MTSDDLTTLLASTELFGGLDPMELDALAARGKPANLERGNVLFRQGDEAGSMYLVTSGRIAMTRGFFGNRESVLALMEPGDLFGEMAMLDGRARSADARALETSAVVEFDYEPIRALYERRPELLWRMVSLLSERLRTMDEALADSMFLDVAGRTAKRILEMSQGVDVFELPVTQEELAGMVGASRERVNKALASFVKLGWLEQAERRYRILNRPALELRAS